MKRILIIDDERIFPSLEGEDVKVVYARTSQAAIDVLYHLFDWDEVWFDHDLGEGDDAMKVYDFMEKAARSVYTDEDGRLLAGIRWSKYIRRAYVHSMNPVGATNLRSRIKDFGIPTLRVGLPDGHTTIHA